MTATGWFSVDCDGLRQLVASRPPVFALLELISNAWDEASTRVDVSLTPIDGRRGRCELVVVDDNPNGFVDLSHAYTLFAPSAKKADAERRGRFNLGEKLVLALCEEASITSTTGQITFAADGSRSRGRQRTDVGSRFAATIRMTREEAADALTAVRALLPPATIVTTVNGEILPTRAALKTFAVTLPTVVADVDGVLRPSRRQTMVSVYETRAGEEPTVYEMGIPVVALDGDTFHLNVAQKVPLNSDRDNVPPAYLRALRAAVLTHTYELLDEKTLREAWVDAALDGDVSTDAVKAVVHGRYGEDVAIFSPSDPEANKRAADRGYTILHGGSFSREAWERVRDAGVQPAARIFPTGRGIGAGYAGGTLPPAIVTKLDLESLPTQVRDVAAMIARVGSATLDRTVNVELVHVAPPETAAATAWADYGSGRLRLNYSGLGEAWFDKANLPEILDLMIHELAHDRVSDHLSEQYYLETTRIGGVVATLALRDPSLFGTLR